MRVAVYDEHSSAGYLRRFEVGLLVFPELYVPGYTLDPESAHRVAEPADGPSISRARRIAAENRMALVLPYAERAEEAGGRTRYYDSIAVIP